MHLPTPDGEISLCASIVEFSDNLQIYNYHLMFKKTRVASNSTFQVGDDSAEGHTFPQTEDQFARDIDSDV